MISKQTIEQVEKILIEEVGKEKASKIIRRLWTETKGNKSYTDSLVALNARVSK